MCDLKQQEKKMRKIKKNLAIDVEVKFIPFPCEDARQEAYRTHARLWLRAKEREIKKEGEIFPENLLTHLAKKDIILKC